MRCRQGDLAVVVHSDFGNEGKILRCVRLHNSTTHDLDGVPFYCPDHLVRWVVEPPLTVKNASGQIVPLYTVADARLRPIRDGEGADESLTWAGNPHKEPA